MQTFLFEFRKQLENLKPSIDKLYERYPSGLARAVALTVQVIDQNQSYDFLGRYFAPWVGIAEDPVTGILNSSPQRKQTVGLHKAKVSCLLRTG